MDAGPDRCTDEWAGDVDPQVRPAAAPEQGGRARGRVAKPCIPRSSSNTSSATPDSAAESKADPISPLDVPGPRAGGHRPGIVRNRLLVDRLGAGTCSTRPRTVGCAGLRAAGSPHDRPHYSGVTGAPTEISAEVVLDLGLRGVWALVEQRFRAHQHPRCAEAALHPALLEKRGL